MKVLLIEHHPTIDIPGVWNIRIGRNTVATLVQPNLDVTLGILPTNTAIRGAALEISPACGITDQTPVRFVGGELQKWVNGL